MQVEIKEKARMELQSELKKLKTYKREHKDDKSKLINMTQQVLLKLVKKKKDNLKEAFSDLSHEDKDNFIKMLQNIHRAKRKDSICLKSVNQSGKPKK